MLSDPGETEAELDGGYDALTTCLSCGVVPAYIRSDNLAQSFYREAGQGIGIKALGQRTASHRTWVIPWEKRVLAKASTGDEG